MEIALTLLLLLACWMDLRVRRISNALVLTGLGVVFVARALPAAMRGDVLELAHSMSFAFRGASVGFLLFLPLYLIRSLGAGDVKLLAMVGAFVGSEAVIGSALIAFLAGGLLSLAFMLNPAVARLAVRNFIGMCRRGVARLRGLAPASGDPTPLQRTAVRIPYALAIAAGTWGQMLLARSA